MATSTTVRPDVDKAEIERTIRAEEAKWLADFRARDIDALLSHSSPDAPSNFLDPDAASITFEESRKALEEAFKDSNLDATFQTHYFGIADSGELAYCRGDYQNWASDPDTGEKVIVSSGAYINVWKKNAEGKWKTIEDLLAPSAKAAAARE